MNPNPGMIFIPKSCRTSLFLLIVLALLLSCAYLQPPVSNSPGETSLPDASNGSPSSTSDSSAPLTAVSTPEPDILTDSSQVAPVKVSPTPSPVQVPARYDLDVVFDFEQHSLSVDETINYLYLSTDSLTDMLLIVEPNLIPKGFTIISMTWEDGNAIETYTLLENQLQFPLPHALHKGEGLGIRINYQLEIPELSDISSSDRPVAYGYSDRQTNLVDWYPYVPAYRDGEGWLVHSPWDLGEYQVYDVADFNVIITLAEPVPELVIAASAPALQEGDHCTYYLPAARTFALSASTEYLLQTTRVGDITINSYTFPYDKYAGQEVLHNTADALQLYSQLVLPYSRPSLNIVEADFLDGMESEGLFFLSHGFYDLYDGTTKGYLTFIAAHETAHQWWYGLVGNDQAQEPWLDEAMSTYMERIFYETIYSVYPPHSGGSLVDWWWDYRVNFYDPKGWVDSSIYDFSKFRPYRNAVYLNGARFMDDLRTLVGDKEFFAFLRDYAYTNTHRLATAEDFFTILRRHTSQNLDGLLAQYFQFGK